MTARTNEDPPPNKHNKRRSTNHFRVVAHEVIHTKPHDQHHDGVVVHVEHEVVRRHRVPCTISRDLSATLLSARNGTLGTSFEDTILHTTRRKTRYDTTHVRDTRRGTRAG